MLRPDHAAGEPFPVREKDDYYPVAQQEFANWYGDPVQSYHPPHDRRHQLNAVLSYDLPGFRLSARWQLGSGLPFTRPIGFDDALRFSVARQDVRTNPGTTRLILERPFTGRLPAVHRLDVSAEREFGLPGGDLVVRTGAVNAYDRRNMFYYDLFTGRRLDQLPSPPSRPSRSGHGSPRLTDASRPSPGRLKSTPPPRPAPIYRVLSFCRVLCIVKNEA